VTLVELCALCTSLLDAGQEPNLPVDVIARCVGTEGLLVSMWGPVEGVAEGCFPALVLVVAVKSVIGQRENKEAEDARI
jgi:hypothetical protein